jgi:uncharacterized protein (DUF779 family)
MYTRVDVTDEARRVIDQLREAHGPLMFHQSGGCCDGSSPMCFQDGEFRVGASFYISKSQFEHWQNTHLTIDVTPGRGASFSLEIPLGVRFVTKSRLFTEEEKQDLVPVSPGSG